MTRCLADRYAMSLSQTIDRLADLLPAQGPISIFIHHNTLHAFEELPFEEAVELAGERLGCEPFLPESRYRDKLASGRILARDVESLLRLQLGARGADDVAGVGSRLELWRRPIFASSTIVRARNDGRCAGSGMPASARSPRPTRLRPRPLPIPFAIATGFAASAGSTPTRGSIQP
jgi:hypothetical protein